MLTGVWIPLITPFKDGHVDLVSYRRLIEHYIACGVAGLFPLGTTGEAPTLDDDEVDEIVATTVEIVADRLPIFVGIGGNATHKVIKTIDRLERFQFPGIVSVCPYYNRPTQDGLLQHFAALSDATHRQILIYNVPYRTSVNFANDTLLHLAERPNIVGVKDSSGSIAQSLELLARKPPDFSVLSGEDALFFSMMCNGADGGILAAAHLATEQFVEIANLIISNDHVAARTIWSSFQGFIPRLFQEANPMPIKYCLWRHGLIRSPECRLPLSSISEGLARELDHWLEKATVALVPTSPASVSNRAPRTF
ncbi:MAG: 4-hydroxy-tetrahydrodipicolinate synthase [Bradyrhizobiaceae bacterium]|nr:4-hydroxy-tetrahydrodipicolinate synthase [Bradyrhizobiaceae bacterium]